MGSGSEPHAWRNLKILPMGKIIRRTICFVLGLCLCIPLHAQSRRISGRVTEKNTAGQEIPIVGASVLVKGTARGTSTDAQGRYTIDAAASETLQFRFLGYADRETVVGNRTVIDMTMMPESQMIEDLIVVGYGTQRKSDIASSITTVNTEDMKIFPSATAAEMLRGRAPGVTVTSTSGRPGSVPSITIRGTRSISASNSPLYVIDGCVSSDTEFAMLNADDIESIEILKDAASQAIYGARASDGVILITTKHGKAGESQINYNGYVGIQRLHRNFDFYSGDEWVALRREAVAHDMGYISASDLPIATALSDEIMQEVYKTGNFVDWEDLMFRKAAVYHNHEISFRGGTDKLKASASAGYYNQDGLIRTNSGYERLNGRLNLDWEARKWLTLGINSSFGFSKRKTENGSFYQFITRTPLAQVYDENGEYTTYINSNGDKNPLFNAQHDDRQTIANNYRINFFADFRLFKGFTYRFNVSYYNRVSEEGHARDSQYTGGGSTASLTNSTSIKTLLENVIRYDVPIRNENHKLNLTAVQSIDRQSSKSLGYTVQNLPVDKGFNYIANGEITDQERDFGENNLVSFMFRAQYNFRDKYLLNVAYRCDGSSRFGIDNKWGHFPSVAAAWRINQEGFLRDAEQIDNLKLRISYGVVGNQNGIGNYTTLGLATPMPGEFGDTYYMGYLPGNELSNQNLKWEQSATANFGLDFGFFRNRLTGTVEYYRTRTTDLLVTRSLNASLGYTSMLDNLGETKTSGVDIGITGELLRKKNLSWTASINFSHFKNEIVKIDDAVDENGRPASQPGNNWIVGAPINVYYDYEAVGVYQYDDFDVYDDGSGNLSYVLKPTIDTDGDGVADKVLSRNDVVQPGSVKLRDVNGDGKIDESDRVVYQRDPDYTISFSTGLSWRNFDFYMDWYGVVGGYVLNPLLYNGEYGGDLRGKSNGIRVNYWTPFNPTNEFPRPTYGSDIPYLQSMAYQDASYLRLRTLQIGYTIPERISRKLRLSKFRIYATATNLLTFTDVLSYSPEVLGNSYPEAQTYVFGVNLSF